MLHVAICLLICTSYKIYSLVKFKKACSRELTYLICFRLTDCKGQCPAEIEKLRLAYFHVPPNVQLSWIKKFYSRSNTNAVKCIPFTSPLGLFSVSSYSSYVSVPALLQCGNLMYGIVVS